jgi:hypothetical protein
MTETADERAERLLAVGLDVAVQIRDDDPEAVARLLQALDRTEMRDLVMVLAAAVDINVSRRILFGWWNGQPRELRPCGTPGGAGRHRYRNEPLCDPCREAQREYDRVRARERRAA